MSRQPSPKEDALRAMREARFKEGEGRLHDLARIINRPKAAADAREKAAAIPVKKIKPKKRKGRR